MSDDLVEQITVYLSNGGLFNPEMMDHDKVRNLLMDCRDRIEKLEATLRYIERHAGNPNIWYAKISRKALEGKDD